MRCTLTHAVLREFILCHRIFTKSSIKAVLIKQQRVAMRLVELLSTNRTPALLFERMGCNYLKAAKVHSLLSDTNRFGRLSKGPFVDN